MQMYDEEQSKISEIEFESYSINLNSFDKVEQNYFYADERSSLSLIKKILSSEYDNKEYGVFHSRFSKALYVFSLIFLPLIIFKLIKKPDDKSGLIISIIVTFGILIKFIEITMESILINNNNLVIINYLLPIIIFIIIILFLFVNVNYIKEKLKS